MKSSVKIIIKVCVIFLFLCLTPFMNGLKSTFVSSKDWLNSLVYHQKTMDQSISLKDHLNVLSYNSNLTIPKEDIEVETTQDNPPVVPTPPTQTPEKDNNSDTTNQKKIYIYNTHQEEGYEGGKTVLDAGAILAKHLEDKGFKVILETNDFVKYRDSLGLDYNKSYVVSYKYLNDALVNYGGFDLCIDLHRDSIPRSASYIEANGKQYATAMMVVGGLGKNAEHVTKTSTTLTDIMNTKLNGIMRSVMTREAFYNQEVHENVVLMEVGGDVNTFEEVSNTLGYIADGIHDLLN
ncbi:stage II sporulation protein P [Amedibacillus sp. YH-ame10]